MSFLFTAYRGSNHRDTYYNANGCVTCGCLVEDDWPTQRCMECRGVPVDWVEESANRRRTIQRSLDWIQREDPNEYNKRVAEMIKSSTYQVRQEWIVDQEKWKRKQDQEEKRQHNIQGKDEKMATNITIGGKITKVSGRKRKREDTPEVEEEINDLQSPDKKQKI